MSDRTNATGAAMTYPPRLARLYSEDVRKLEAKHAGRLSSGAKTWDEAVEALYHRMTAAGPAKGAKRVQQAVEYLNSVGDDERIHLAITASSSKRAAHLMFFTFSIGPHPDPAVREEGLKICMHMVKCGRSQSLWGRGVSVAYISKHALIRLYERGQDITENVHAHSIFTFIGVLGYLIHHSDKHRDGGLSMVFASVLAVGNLHRCEKRQPNGGLFEECFFDVRTVLPVDEIGPHRQALLDQGQIAASTVTEWFKNEDELSPAELAELIPALPRRDDSYPVRINQGRI